MLLSLLVLTALQEPLNVRIHALQSLGVLTVLPLHKVPCCVLCCVVLC